MRLAGRNGGLRIVVSDPSTTTFSIISGIPSRDCSTPGPNSIQVIFSISIGTNQGRALGIQLIPIIRWCVGMPVYQNAAVPLGKRVNVLRFLFIVYQGSDS